MLTDQLRMCATEPSLEKPDILDVEDSFVDGMYIWMLVEANIHYTHAINNQKSFKGWSDDRRRQENGRNFLASSYSSATKRNSGVQLPYGP